MATVTSAQDKERVRALLKETVTCLCKRGLAFKQSFRIEGLLGITIDEQEVFLVNLNETETVNKGNTDSGCDSASPFIEITPIADTSDKDGSTCSPHSADSVPQQQQAKATGAPTRTKRKRTPKRKPPSIASDQSSPPEDASSLYIAGASHDASFWDGTSTCETESMDSGSTPAKRPLLSSSDTSSDLNSSDQLPTRAPLMTLGDIVVKSEPQSDSESNDYNDNFTHKSLDDTLSSDAGIDVKGMSLPINVTPRPGLNTTDVKSDVKPLVFSHGGQSGSNSSQETLKGLVAQIRVTPESGILLPQELKTYVYQLSQGRPSKYVRKFVHILFPNTEELANSSCLGLKTGHHPAQALDTHRVEIIKEATMAFYPNLLHKEFIHIMNECCRDARAKIKRLSQQMEWHQNHGTTAVQKQTGSPLIVPQQQTASPLILPKQQANSPLAVPQTTAGPLILPKQQTSTPLVVPQVTASPLILPKQQANSPLVVQTTSSPLILPKSTTQPQQNTATPARQSNSPLIVQQIGTSIILPQQTGLLQQPGSPLTVPQTGPASPLLVPKVESGL